MLTRCSLCMLRPAHENSFSLLVTPVSPAVRACGLCKNSHCKKEFALRRFSSRCFKTCDDCMVSVIHLFWNISFMLVSTWNGCDENCSKLCRRGEQNSDEISVQRLANWPPRGLLAIPPIPFYTLTVLALLWKRNQHKNSC